MDKSSDNTEVSHLPETCEELPKPSNQDESSDFSDLQNALYDEEVYDLLIILNESGHSLPKYSRTLLKTDQKATSTTLFNRECTLV